MKTIITYGTFDILHIGHVNLLKRAKALGEKLIVAVSSDEFNIVKHKSSLLNYANRRFVVESIRYVDLVIPEIAWEQKIEDIKKYDVDIFVMGDDWEGEFNFLQEYCEVIYLPRTEEISSTLIKNNLF